MKKMLFVLVLMFCHLTYSQVKSERIMHRIQDTTKSQSGWYYGKSTDGHFSIELPIPFNDATIIVDRFKTYIIGSTSQEGFKFGVTEVKNKKSLRKVNLEEIANEFIDENTEVSNITKFESRKLKSIYFELKNYESGCYMKYTYYKKRFFMISIEYPIDQAEMIAAYKDYFFESFTYLR